MPPLPQIFLVRHGETAWSRSGQHTGGTDVPLTTSGEDSARRLGQRLGRRSFVRVWTSPMQRARRTCELAGFGAACEIQSDLREWDYGAYEGLKPEEIQRLRPGWELFRDGCPEGESVAAVAARVDRVIVRLRDVDGDVLLFSHGHFLRALAARWMGLDAGGGRLLVLGTAALSILGYNHNRNEPALRLWNEMAHIAF